MKAASEAWDAAASDLWALQSREIREADDMSQPQQRKVDVLKSVLAELRKADGDDMDSAAATRDTEAALEAAIKELHLPLGKGWLFRVSHGGVLLGLQDFLLERCCAALSLSLSPGRLATGSQQASLLRITLDASGGGEKRDRQVAHSISVRLEKLQLNRLSTTFSLMPSVLEVASLTIHLRCVLHCSFAFGTDGRWVCSSSKLELHSLRTEAGSGHLLSDLLIRWLLERLLPGVLSKALLKRLPVELGRYLQSATEPCEMLTELTLHGTPLSVMNSRLPSPISPISPLSPEDDVHIARAAQALRVAPSELRTALSALRALQAACDAKGSSPQRRRANGERAAAQPPPAVSPAYGSNPCSGSTSPWKLDGGPPLPLPARARPCRPLPSTGLSTPQAIGFGPPAVDCARTRPAVDCARTRPAVASAGLPDSGQWQHQPRRALPRARPCTLPLHAHASVGAYSMCRCTCPRHTSDAHARA